MATRSVKMSDAVTAKLNDLAKKMRGTVSVGFIDSDQAPIAFWNEYGHKGPFPAPPRPFFRTMVSSESPKWPGMMASQISATNIMEGSNIATKADGKKILRFMGEEIEGKLKQSIIDFSGEPLSPVSLLLRSQFWSNPEDIRARDVLAAQELIKEGYGVGILLPGKRLGRSKKAAPMVSFTQAKPLVWTGDLLNSTSYKVSQ